MRESGRRRASAGTILLLANLTAGLIPASERRPAAARAPQVLTFVYTSGEALGRPRGAVLRRLGEGVALPDVVWRCAYPDAASRAADVAALEAEPAWRPVPERMGTLLRRFSRGTYSVLER
jgi:hypothetical protein